jgi:hypothetical protein
MSDFPGEISELLAKWETGDKEALRVLKTEIRSTRLTSARDGSEAHDPAKRHGPYLECTYKSTTRPST